MNPCVICYYVHFFKYCLGSQRGRGVYRAGRVPQAQGGASHPSNVAQQMNKRQRWFVALFDYDPTTMSPNPDACEEELPFSEGDTIKVLILYLILHHSYLIFVIIETILIKLKLKMISVKRYAYISYKTLD